MSYLSAWARTVRVLPAHSARAIAALAIILLSASSRPVGANGIVRVRTESPFLRSVLAEGAARSATLRSLVERIEKSDVIVYLTCEQFSSTRLRGRTSLMAARAGTRYVRAAIACLDTDLATLSIVAHELEHVVEITSFPSVVDTDSFVRLYSAIGYTNCEVAGIQQFETTAAIQAGERVRREFLTGDKSAVKASSAGTRVLLDRKTPLPIP